MCWNPGLLFQMITEGIYPQDTLELSMADGVMRVSHMDMFTREHCRRGGIAYLSDLFSEM